MHLLTLLCQILGSDHKENFRIQSDCSICRTHFRLVLGKLQFWQ